MWTVDWVSFFLSHSVVSDSVTPSTVARQAPLSMGFSRQESWSGLPFPSPRDLPDPGIEPMSPVSLALQGDSFPRWATRETSSSIYQGGSEGCFSALNVHVKHLGILEKSRSRLCGCGGGPAPTRSPFPSRHVDLQLFPTLSFWSSFPFTDFTIKCLPGEVQPCLMCLLGIAIIDLILPVKQNLLRKSVGAQSPSLDWGDNDKAVPRAGSWSQNSLQRVTPTPERLLWPPSGTRDTASATRWGRDPAWLRSACPQRLSPCLLPRQSHEEPHGGGNFWTGLPTGTPGRVELCWAPLPAPIWAHFPVHELL